MYMYICLHMYICVYTHVHIFVYYFIPPTHPTHPTTTINTTTGMDNDALGQQVKHLATLILEEAVKQHEISNNPTAAAAAVALQRCAAELYGLAAAVGGGARAAEVVRDVCRRMAETNSFFMYV